VAAALVTSLASQPVLSTHALANAKSETEATLNVSFDIPEGGQIDMYHSITTHRDNLSNAMYVLRNTTVEDLLNTRRGLKILLGGTERGRKVSGDPQLTFAAPGGVIDLFMLGGLGREYSQNEPKPLVQAPSHGIDDDGVPGIAGPVNWLSSQEPAFDPALRLQMVRGLIYISAQLSKIDQALKYFQKDFWDNSKIADEFYLQQVEKLKKESLEQGKEAPLLILTDHLKQEWMDEHGMTDTLAALAGQREYLLDRYHLLAIEVDKVPLYQHIYDALEKVSFPDNAMVQKVTVEHLPPGIEPIPFATEFESQVDQQLERMGQADGAQMVEESAYFVDSKIDKALLISLKNNTEKLEELTRDTDFTGAGSPMADLAQYDDLWDVAQKRYGYLAGMINFKEARESSKKYIKAVEDSKAKLRYTAYGVGIGLGIVGTIATMGTGAEVVALGLTAKQILFGASLVTTAQAGFDYVDSKKSATLARGLYLGSAKNGSYKLTKETQIVSEESYQYLIVNLVMLGCQLPLVSALSKGRAILTNGKNTFVALHEPEIQMIREAIAKVAPRAQALAPLGKALLATARNLLGQQAMFNEMVTLNQAVIRVAAQLKTTPAKIYEVLKKTPIVNKLITGWEERVMVTPDFLASMIREQGASFTVGMVAEYMARGDNLPNELNWVALDTFTSAVLTAGLVWWDAKTPASIKLNLPRHMFDKGLSPLQRATIFGKRFRNNFIMGWGVHLPTDLAINAYQHAKNPDEKSLGDRLEYIGKSGLLSSILLGVSSNIRFQGMSKLEDVLLARMKNDPNKAKIILYSSSLANNLFGNYTYIMAAKATGVQSSAPMLEATDEAEDLYERELAKDPDAQKYGFKPVSGAFIKLEQENDAAAYLLDFLRRGEEALPNPANP